MKNSSEGTLREIENSLKKIQERSSGKKFILIIIGVSILLTVALFAFMKLKKVSDNDDLDDDLDDDDFDDDLDDDDIREDYYALDYEDEE